MRLSELTLADTGRLTEFYQNLSPAVSETYRPFPEITTKVMEDHLAGAVEGRHISRAIEDAGTIIGHSFILSIDEKHPVFGIGISDKIHGMGWGRKLMGSVLQDAQTRGVSYITLTVLKYNIRAFTMYKSFGFTVVSDHTFKDKNDSYFMIRKGEY